MARGDGKTTRQIERAIEWAREGTRILYITRGPVGYYADIARRIAPEAIYGASRQELLIPHGAPLMFREDVHFREDYLRGLDGFVVVDHAAKLRPEDREALFYSPHWQAKTDVPDAASSPGASHTDE